MSALISKREDFLDANGGITTATNIYDSLTAAVFLFLTVQEVFSMRLENVVNDLILYDSTAEVSVDAISTLQLLVKARALLAVNPSLAVNHVRKFRTAYKLSNVTPMLLTQIIDARE